MLRIIFFVSFLFIEYCLIGQKPDTCDFYNRLKKISEKHKITRILYESIFLSQDTQAVRTLRNYKSCNFEKYENCLIRYIKINVSDPFTNETDNPLVFKSKILKNSVNKLHFSTKEWVIANKLLFKCGQPLKSIALRESERLIRQSSYVNDVEISIEEIDQNDSVDIHIEVKDKWAINFPIKIISENKLNATLSNNNLLGFGQSFEQNADFDLKGSNNFSSKYTIENIKNSFISTSVFYSYATRNQIVGIDISRPSSSILIKWSGGQYFEQNFREDYLALNIIYNKNYQVNSLYSDTWVVRRFPLINKSVLGNISGFSSGLRFFKKEFQKRPPMIDEWKSNYLNKSGILFMVNFYLQRFLKEKFVYRFGSFEDIPIGLIFQITNGYLNEEFETKRKYFSIYLRGANKFKIGYWSVSGTLSTFYSSQSTNEVFFRTNAYFFSRLKPLYTWSFRNFVQLDFMKDMNSNLRKTIQLRSSDIYSIPLNSISGYSKCIMNTETIFYAPYQLSGFRFATVLVFGTGLIQQQANEWTKLNAYHSLALGILLRNENLLNSTLQFSVGYYPILPPGQNKNFIIEPITSFTLRVNGFSAFKPDLAEY